MSTSRYIAEIENISKNIYIYISHFYYCTSPVGCVMCVAAHSALRYGRVGATADEQKGQHCWRHRGADLFAPHRLGGVLRRGVNWRCDACHISKYIRKENDDGALRGKKSAPLIHFSPLCGIQLSRFNSCVHHLKNRSTLLRLLQTLYSFFLNTCDPPTNLYWRVPVRTRPTNSIYFHAIVKDVVNYYTYLRRYRQLITGALYLGPETRTK